MLLGTQPRFRLATLPTPLQEAARLRDALGGPTRTPRILIKRDDLTGLAFGGNKVRKLEFLIADALAKNATTLITAGAVQSNHARATAAAACVAGLRSVLVLETKVEAPAEQGNLLLDRLLGAGVRFVPAGTEMDAAMAAVARELEAAGERAYVIPIGGSSEIGVFGYVAATLELMDQLFALGTAPSRLYYANGSRGTQAGLALGAKMFGAPYAVTGILISPGETEKRRRALEIANGAAMLLGSGVRLTPDDLESVDGFIGEGYAAPTPECDEAIRLLARTEALFLDPVYSGKAMAGMISQIRTGAITPDETIVFLHTGGQPALFAHAERLAAVANA